MNSTMNSINLSFIPLHDYNVYCWNNNLWGFVSTNSGEN